MLGTITGVSSVATASNNAPASVASAAHLAATAPEGGKERATRFTAKPLASLAPLESLSAESGSIAGIVRANSTTVIAGVTVSAYFYDEDAWEFSETASATAVTGTNGRYLLEGLADGYYFIEFIAPTGSPEYASEWYNNALDLYESTPVEIEDGAAVTNISVTLAAAAKITGQVLGSLNGSTVTLDPAQTTIEACSYWMEECGLGRATLRADGTFTITNLAAGEYIVRAAYSGSGNFRNEYYPNTRSIGRAPAIDVLASETRKISTIVLNEGGVLSGIVTHGGEPVEGITVSANFVDEESYPDPENFEKSAVSDSTGAYSVGGLWPDTYSALAHGTSELASEWAIDALSAKDALQIPVTSTTRRTDLDFELASAGTISGSVVDSISGEALADVFVGVGRFASPTSSKFEFVGIQQSASDGSYSFDGLAAGDYLLATGSENYDYLTLFHGAEYGEGPASATRLTVVAEETTTVTLSALHSGTVVGTLESTDGSPIAGAEIRVSESEETISGPDGSFEVTGLEPGEQDVTVYADPLLYATTTVTTDVAAGSIPTDLGTIVLESASIITGRVTSPSGGPVAYSDVALVQLLPSGESEEVTHSETSKTGTYRLGGLSAGTYFILVRSGSYPTQFAGGTSEITTASPVEITGPGQSTVRDVSLYAGSSISGRITSKTTGKPINWVDVDVKRLGLNGETSEEYEENYTYSEYDGVYGLSGLAAGSYEVTFNGSQSYENYGSVTRLISVGRAPLVVNAQLSPLTAVTGTVIDGNGNALEEIDVEIYDENDEWVAGTSTVEDGLYRIYAAPGTYTIRYSDTEGRVLSRWYGGATTAADAQPVTVAKTTVANINVTLPIAVGGVSGSFSSSAYWAGYAIVLLERIEGTGEDEEVVSSDTRVVFTDGGSDFELRGLDAGNYRLTAYTEGVLGYYVGQTTFTVADPDALLDIGDIELTLEQLDAGPSVTGAQPAVITDGYPEIGDELFAAPGEWTEGGEPFSGEFSYQWLRDGKIIPNATAETHTVSPGDVGKRISVRVSPTYDDFVVDWLSVASAGSEVVIEGTAPVATSAPVISGAPRVGTALLSTPGSWDVAGVTIDYRWERRSGAATPIVVSRSARYTPVTADAATSVDLVLVVSASKRGYATGSTEVAVGDVAPATKLKRIAHSKVSMLAGEYVATAGVFSPAATSVRFDWLVHEEDGSATTVQSGSQSTFDPSEEDADKYISVIVTGSRSGYAPNPRTYIANVGPQIEWVEGSEPTASGTNRVGARATVSHAESVTVPSSATGKTSFAYRWFVNGTVVAGATRSTFTPTTVGELTAEVVASRVGYVTSEPFIVQFGDTAPALATISGEVSIVGSALVGRTLTYQLDSGWEPTPTSVTLQWLRTAPLGSPVAITGATGASYMLTTADEGSTVSLRVTAKRTGYGTAVITAETEQVVAAPIAAIVAPAIRNRAVVGSALTAQPGSWDVSGATFSYQWLVNGRNIAGAIAPSYTPIADDLNEEISVRVTARKAGVTTGSAVSNASVVQPGAAITATQLPVISRSGSAFVTTRPVWSATGVETRYQWQVRRSVESEWVDLEDATSTKLVIDRLDTENFATGWSYRVVASATKLGFESSKPVAARSLALTAQ